MAEPVNKCRPSDATIRALQRVAAGERPTHAAAAETINPSTLFRALAKKRPPRFFLIIAKERGGFNAWIENEHYKQQGTDVQTGISEDQFAQSWRAALAKAISTLE